MKTFGQQLFENYDFFLEKSIQKRRFSFDEFLTTIEKHLDSDFLKIHRIGKSIEQRSIYSLKVGKGKTRVMLWSQMHGNEPTATLALLDIFNFMTQKQHFQKEISLILDKLEILFVPLVNPDGAQQYKRRNAVNIDLNRDAEALQAPESQFLMSLRNEFQPEFGFNLHDQDSHFSAGITDNPAAIAFLAPAFDEERNVDDSRKKAMQVIAQMNQLLQQFIPEQTAKYSDIYNSKCFGDAVQKARTSTILIESGWTQNDSEKQFIRKLNFVMIISALHSIALSDYENATVDDYQKIQDNYFNLFDLIIRNVNIIKENQTFCVDIGIKRNEVELPNLGDFYFDAQIDNIGDLAAMFSYKDFNASGLVAEVGEIYPIEINTIEELEKLNHNQLFANGYTTIRSRNRKDLLAQKSPFHIIDYCIDFENRIDIKTTANFVLKQNDIVEYAVVNGFLFIL